jgi:DNA anti-recombination protein RmuC
MMPPETAPRVGEHFADKVEARREKFAAKVDARRAKIEQHAENADPEQVAARLERLETKSSERMERFEQNVEKHAHHAADRIDVYA